MRAVIMLAALLAGWLVPNEAHGQFVVESITPELSSIGQAPFTITGSFPAWSTMSYVEIDGTPVTVTSVSPTEIQGVAQAHPPTTSPVAVTVSTPSGMATLPDAVSFIGPLEVLAVDPPVVSASGLGGPGSTLVTIEGVGFIPGMVIRVQPDGAGGGGGGGCGGTSGMVPSSFTEFVDARTYQMYLPSLSPGTYRVRMQVAVAGLCHFDILNGALTVVDDLELGGFEPSEASTHGGQPFQLFGDGFTPNTVVTIGTVEVDTTFVSSTVLTGTIPPNPGYRIGAPVPVTATDPATGPGMLAAAFVYTDFALASVTPPFIVEGATSIVTLQGSGLTPDTMIEFGGLPALGTTFISDAWIDVELPPLPPGVHDVYAYVSSSDPLAEQSLEGGFTVASPEPPVVTHVEPSLACADGGTFVVITGERFLPETTVYVSGIPLLEKAVDLGGHTITGIIPPDPGTGGIFLLVGDFRGEFASTSLLAYGGSCGDLPAIREMESATAYGTARFSWHNPTTYTAIAVYSDTGSLIETLSGSATSYQAAVASDSLTLYFEGQVDDICARRVPETARPFDCEYPPPIGGAVVPGELALSIRGGHAPADVERCNDGDGPQGPFAAPRFQQPSGSIGFVTPHSVLGPLGPIGARPTTLRTGFTLEQPADRLDISGYYRKIATDFGLQLRGRLIHVFPDDGFSDEFTLPDPFVGADHALHSFTYYRATDDPASPDALPCLDGSGALKKIPAGDYLLEIYAVGGTPAAPYYIFADDPRDYELLIEGTPCPPYPLVQVRDVTGFRTLPNIGRVKVMTATERPDGKVEVTLSARGTWFDETGMQWSIDPYCDRFLAGYIGSDGTIVGGGCADPPYQAVSDLEYCWAIHTMEPPECKIDDSVCTTVLPDWGCYKIDLTVIDKACGTSRTFFHEVALVPADDSICVPGNQDYSFVFPTPDPAGTFAIGNLSNPSPGNGHFADERPFACRVLVVPRCYCDGASPAQCTTPLVFEDTPTTPPGAPSDLSDPGDDVQFRLVVRRPTGDYDLDAEIRVTDLCPDVVGGPKYFYVYVDDLGEIPFHPQLHDTDFRKVHLQGRTNCIRQVIGTSTVCVPPASAQWWDIGGPLEMTNHPAALDDAYWSGHYEEGDGTYRFAVNSTDDQEESFPLGDSEPLGFGIVDAGVPSYSGNNVGTGFTSRIACQLGAWFSEDGAGSSSGALLGNEIDSAPQVVEGTELSVATFAGGFAPAYRWCDHTDIFEHEMSQDLFRSIIYAGFIGPVPVNIWASVGLGLKVMIDSYLEFRVSPFVQLPTGNYVEMQYTLVSSVFVTIPCQIGADILGGIASVVLRLRPEVYFEFDPYIIAGLGATPQLTLDYYLLATFALYMDVEACIQTLIFGEQCLPAIEIPLVEETDIIDPHGTSPVPEDCDGGGISTIAAASSAFGKIGWSSYEIANMPISIVSPDGSTVVDAWASEDGSGKLLKVCVTTNGGTPIQFSLGLPGAGWYLLDPQAAFVDNDTVLFTGTSPPASFSPESPPMDVSDPDYLTIRNANVAHTEIKLGLLKRVPGMGWTLDLNSPPLISDDTATPTVDRRADGRASIAADPIDATALVSWVRYTGDYLIQDGFIDAYFPSAGSCTSSLCLVPQVPNVRPQMEATSIVVRRVDENGTIPGEEIRTISEPGINIQPSIAVSPSGNIAYCAWVHDPVHTDLISQNRGRSLVYSVYQRSTDSWSPPMSVLEFPNDYPALLEPTMVLRSEDDGLVVFTALPSDAAPDDSGLGGGSRLVFGCRLIDGVFGDPVVIRGRCEARQYGWSQSVTFNVPEWIDPATQLHHALPDWIMSFLDFGQIGTLEGSGNILVTVLDDASGTWTPPIAIMEPGTVMTNPVSSVAGGSLHTIHFSTGPALAGGFAGVAPLGPPAPTGYQVHDTPLYPDAAIARCELVNPFAGPGSPVRGALEIENRGLASTPYTAAGASATGIEIYFVDEEGTETVLIAAELPILRAGEKYPIDFEIEMPLDPVRLRTRISPNPTDRDRSNDQHDCYLGAPAPREFGCEIIETTFDDGTSVLSPRLRWRNPVIYDRLLLYRDGRMIHALPGGCEVFTDRQVQDGTHRYQLRGVIGASKSVRVTHDCSIVEPPQGLSFLRGDTNSDGSVNIADAVYALTYLFQFGATPACLASADANFDGQVNIADAVYLLSYLFQGGQAPPAPFPTCAPSFQDVDALTGCGAEGC